MLDVEIMNKACSHYGFITEIELEFLYEIFSKVNFAVEIGSYCGRSTWMISRAIGKDGMLISVDPHSDIYNVDGYIKNDTSWEYFCKNIVWKCDNLSVLRMTSEEAGVFIALRPDIVFIDGDHSPEAISKDLDIWSKKTNAIVVHDYADNGGGIALQNAVDIFLKNSGWKIISIADSALFIGTEGYIKEKKPDFTKFGNFI